MEGGQPHKLSNEGSETDKEQGGEPLSQAPDGAQEAVKDASTRHPPHAHLAVQGGAKLSTRASADAQQPTPDTDRQGEHATVQEQQQGRLQGDGGQLEPMSAEDQPASIKDQPAAAADHPGPPAPPPAPLPEPQRSVPGCQCCGAGLEEERPYHKVSSVSWPQRALICLPTV